MSGLGKAQFDEYFEPSIYIIFALVAFNYVNTAKVWELLFGLASLGICLYKCLHLYIREAA